MDTIQDFVASLLIVLSSEFGNFGTGLGYFLVFSPVVSLLLEIFSLIAKITKTKEDDKIIKKISNIWISYIEPILNILPRVNVPLNAWMRTIVLLSSKVIIAFKKLRR